MHSGIKILNNTYLSSDEHINKVVFPVYSRKDIDIGIVHLGLGAFHRSHQAIYTEQLLNLQRSGDWGICGVSFRNEALQTQLMQQDCVYTSAILDVEDSFQVVGVLKEVLVVKTQLKKVLARMVAVSTKIVSLTVTEKGYCLDANGKLDEMLPDIISDLANITQPRTAIGLLVEALHLRFKAGSLSFNVIACDNLSNNGEKLKSAVLQFAEKVSPELATWIKVNTHFPNTMVDCITPKTEQATIDLIQHTLGVIDNAPVQREQFSQWVIETCDFERPAWENVGVIFTDNVEVFENAKLRVLNGLHSALAYIGSLRGYDTVYEAISDQKIKLFLINLLDNEIIPTLQPVKGLDIKQYSRDIINRFENPKIKHLLRQIACDGSIKIPVRILAPLADNIRAGRSIDGLSVVVAAWLHFIKDSVVRNIGIDDPRAKDFVDEVEKHSLTSESNVEMFLSLAGLIPEELKANKLFISSVTSEFVRDNNLFSQK